MFEDNNKEDIVRTKNREYRYNKKNYIRLIEENEELKKENNELKCDNFTLKRQIENWSNLIHDAQQIKTALDEKTKECDILREENFKLKSDINKESEDKTEKNWYDEYIK